MNFAEVLKSQRREKGLTQEDLADKLLVSSKTISNWETNKTTPDIDNVIRLSNLFDISLNSLLLEGSEMVENIKKKAEIRETKIFLFCSTMTSIVLLFIIATAPIFGELPLVFSVAIALGALFNLFCVLYFSKKYTDLSEKNWGNQTTKQKVWTVIMTATTVIILLAITIYIRFRYSAF